MSKAISRVYLGIIALVVIVGGAAYEYYALQPAAPQQAAVPNPVPQPLQPVPAPKPAPAVADKFKASTAQLSSEASYLVIDAGKDRGIFASNGLDPEWVPIPQPTSAATRKETFGPATKIGISAASEVLLARSEGLPVKILAGVLGDIPYVKLYVRADSSIKTVKDLDGKKIGSTTAAVQRHISVISNKYGIKTEALPVANLDNNTAALKAGRVDAFLTSEGRALKLVDSGELRIILSGNDYTPKPYVSAFVWATEELIQQNPDLVKRFVKATLETTRYVKDNPSYASDLAVKRTNVPKDAADKAVSLVDWTPSGRGTGQDLAAATTSFWQFLKDTGGVAAGATVKIEDVVDTRFLQ